MRPFSSIFCLSHNAFCSSKTSLCSGRTSLCSGKTSLCSGETLIIVFGEDSTVMWEDSIVVWEDSIAVWEDSVVFWHKNCVRKIAVLPYKIYSCEMWKFVINNNSSPGDQKKTKMQKLRKIFFCLVCIFPQGPFLLRKIRKNILPCVHFPAGGFFFFVRKNRFLKICNIKIRQNR